MGFEDGSVVVVDAETGAEIARHLDAGEAHDKQVTCLHWAEDLGGHGAGANPHANSTHADDEQQYSSDDDVDGGARVSGDGPAVPGREAGLFRPRVER